jgi:hypothetical protein
VEDVTKVRKYIGAIAGFGTLFPVQLLDGVGFRLNDAVAVLLACAAAIAIMTAPRGERRINVAYIAIGLCTVGWIGAEFNFSAYLPSNPPAAMILIRWVVAVPAAFYLMLLCRHPLFRKSFLLGAIIGCLASTACLVFDFITFQTTGSPAFRVDTTDIPFVNGDYRAVGLLGHPNGAAIASLFIVPLVIGASQEFRRQVCVLIVTVPVIATVFYTTQTRGALVASICLLLAWGLTHRPGRVLKSLVALAILVPLLLAIVPSVITAHSADDDLVTMFTRRFTADSTMESNAVGRVDTTFTSIEMAFSAPFGMGSTYEGPLLRLTGFTATHNGLLQLALLGGLPLALLVTALLLRSAFNVLLPTRQTPNWTALYLLIVSLFEAVFYIPFFSFLVLWVIASLPAEQRVASASPAGVGNTDPKSTLIAH